MSESSIATFTHVYEIAVSQPTKILLLLVELTGAARVGV